MLASAAAGTVDAPTQRAVPPLNARYAKVDVAPTKTSIYIGTVAITITALERHDAGYDATYATKVFPFFFSNEKGRLRIEFTDEQLYQLERGERVMFKGSAQNEAGAPRRLEGQATPIDATSGKIKVRVFVTEKVELIFNTTYRFTGE